MFYAGYVILLTTTPWSVNSFAVAQTREEAINTMSRTEEYVIEGIKQPYPFNLQPMKDENFRNGNFTTKFLESFKE